MLQKMVSQAWALNRCALAAGATSLPPAKSCSVRRMSQLQRDLAKIFLAFQGVQKAGICSRYQFIVLSAESKASIRVMTLGARAVPLSTAAANKLLACNPTQECCGAGWVRVVVRVSRTGVEGSRSRPALFASEVQPDEQQAHILVQRGIRQLQYRAFFEGEQRE